MEVTVSQWKTQSHKWNKSKVQVSCSLILICSKTTITTIMPSVPCSVCLGSLSFPVKIIMIKIIITFYYSDQQHALCTMTIVLNTFCSTNFSY